MTSYQDPTLRRLEGRLEGEQEDPFFAKMLGRLEKAGPGQELSLEQQVRKSFAKRPLQYELEAYDRQKALLEKRYGSRAELKLTPQGEPSVFVVSETQLSGAGMPKEISVEGVRAEVSKYRDKQRELYQEVLDSGETISFGKRALAGIKATPAGRFGWLQSKYGKENVLPVFNDTNNLEGIIVAEPGKTPKAVDHPSLELADLADVSGDVLEIVPEVIGGVIGARMGGTKGAAVGSAGGAAVGSAIRQAWSAAMPGEDFPGENEAAQRLGAAGINVAGSLLGEGVTAGLRAARPMQRLSRKIGKEMLPESAEQAWRGKGVRGSEMAKRIEPLEREFDVPLSVGQRTLSPTALQTEEFLAQVPAASNIMRGAQAGRLKNLSRAADEVVKRVAGGKAVGGQQAGEAVANAAKALRRETISARSKAVGQLFDEVDRLGGRIEMDNTVAALDEIIAKHGQVARTAPTETILNFARKYREALVGGPQGASVGVSDLGNMLSDMSKRAHADGAVAEGLPISESTVIAKRLYGAMQQDLTDAATQGVTGQAVSLLSAARKEWGKWSKLIEANDSAVFRDAVGFQKNESTSKLAKRFLGAGYGPEQIKKAVGLLNKQDPVVTKQLRAAVMEEMLSSSLRGVEDQLVSPTIFANAFRKNEKALRALFTGDMTSFGKIRRLAIVAERVGATGGTGRSPTAKNMILWEALKSMRGPVPAARFLATLYTAKNLARAMNNPHALDLLVSPPTSIATVAGAGVRGIFDVVTQVSALNARDAWLYDYEDEPPAQSFRAEGAGQRAGAVPPAE